MENHWLLEQAEKKVRSGEFKEATYLLKKLRNHCQDRESRAFVERRLGEIYLQLKFLDKAREHFSAAVRLNTKDPLSHYFLALAMFLGGHVKSTLNYIRKAIAMKPDDAEFYYLHGLALLQMRKYALAEINFRRALEFKPKHIPSYLELARVSICRKENDDAVRFLKRVLSIAPDHLAAKALLRKIATSKKQDAQEKTTRIESMFDQKMQELGYDHTQREKAKKLWRDFLRKRKLKIRKPEVWAAAIHYAISRLEFHIEENQNFLAEVYGVSKKSISLAFQDICATVRLRLYDQRYSTQMPPFDDCDDV